jgi:ATP-dependent Clp protease ATP-binding subunit ClpA
VLRAATKEARRRGDRRPGTDHLLLGVLHDNDSPAVAALGVTLESARAASRALDRAALVAVGVAADHVDIAQSPRTAKRLLPLSSGARAVLKRTVELARPRATSRIESRDFLLALLSRDRPDPAAELVHALGVNAVETRTRLAASRE